MGNTCLRVPRAVLAAGSTAMTECILSEVSREITNCLLPREKPLRVAVASLRGVNTSTVASFHLPSDIAQHGAERRRTQGLTSTGQVRRQASRTSTEGPRTIGKSEAFTS